MFSEKQKRNTTKKAARLERDIFSVFFHILICWSIGLLRWPEPCQLGPDQGGFALPALASYCQHLALGHLHPAVQPTDENGPSPGPGPAFPQRSEVTCRDRQTPTHWWSEDAFSIGGLRVYCWLWKTMPKHETRWWKISNEIVSGSLLIWSRTLAKMRLAAYPAHVLRYTAEPTTCA